MSSKVSPTINPPAGRPCWCLFCTLKSDYWTLYFASCPTSSFQSIRVFPPILWQVNLFDNLWSGTSSKAFSELDCSMSAGPTLSLLVILPRSQQTMFIPVYSDLIFLGPTTISKDGWQTFWSAITQIPSEGLFVARSCNARLPALWQPGACHSGLPSPSCAARGWEVRTEWSFTQEWKPPPREVLGTHFFNFETHLLEFWSEYLKASYSFVPFPP